MSLDRTFITDPGSNDDTLYTVEKVGEIFDVQAETVRGWCRSGKLKAVKLPNRTLRIRKADVVKFANSKYELEEKP